MAEYINSPGASSHNAALMHTLQRHRDILKVPTIFWSAKCFYFHSSLVKDFRYWWIFLPYDIETCYFENLWLHILLIWFVGLLSRVLQNQKQLLYPARAWRPSRLSPQGHWVSFHTSLHNKRQKCHLEMLGH